MIRKLLVLSLALSIAVLSLAPVVYAQGEQQLTSVLTLAPLEPQAVGSRPVIQATLTGEADRPNPNKVLILYVNHERIRRVRTDDNGLADIRISSDLPVGEYEVTVVFEGTEAYYGASATETLTIRPLQLTVETVPPIPDVAFALNGREFKSGPDGLAHVDVMEPGEHTLDVLDVTDVAVSADTRVSFLRWADSVFVPSRTINLRGDDHFQVGFATSHPVTLSFVDLTGKPVAMSRISSVLLKRSDGGYNTFKNDQSQWLQATRIARRREGLEATTVQYSVEDVTMDGANIVNRYQQRFYVENENNWQIELLLYSLRISAADAILGTPAGHGALLEYPDGRVEEIPFGADGTIFRDSLARGIYRVTVTGVRGMAPATPVALTRNQEIQLKVLTATDIAGGAALGAIVAVGLLFYGRPRILKLLTRPSTSIGQARTARRDRRTGQSSATHRTDVVEQSDSGSDR